MPLHQNAGMPLVPLDTRTALYLVGVVYLLTSGLVWMILRRHHDRFAVSLWCGGGVVLSAAYLMITFRAATAAPLTVQAPTLLLMAGFGLRAGALQRESGHTVRWPVIVGLTSAAMVISMFGAIETELMRRTVNSLLQGLGSIGLAVLARQVSRQPGGRGAELISGAYAFLAVTYLLRFGVSLLGGTISPPFTPTLDLALVLAGGLVAGIFGNVGYMGMALEGARLRDEAQAGELEKEQAQRSAAEAEAAMLGARLAERDEFVRVLAHEVRQPLNNALAALQGADAAMQASSQQDRGEAQARLQRAQKVIGHIVGAIDNTLAATTLLASAQPLSPRDADVNMLVELSMGDLDPQQRTRVRREDSPHARTAAMDIGLMRLALRNLLANALAYSPPGSPVTLQISDRDEPLGLVFEVRDEGPGLADSLRGKLFERGARGDHGLPGHGLGLYVVQKIMHRHGGDASWAPNTPQGSVFRLWLPLVD